MNFRFIHTADIHLDSPFVGLSKYEGAPINELKTANRKAFSNLVDLAIEKEISFLLIAGDLFDGDWDDFNTGLFFIQEISRLKEKNINVYIIRGNHDASNVISNKIILPDNVHIFSDNEAETCIVEEIGVAIHGKSYKSRAVYDNLAIEYPKRMNNSFNIGLLHTSLNGREGHDNYAPCSIDQLKSKGYDYWALGHIHKQEIISENPFIAFSGNIQGRSIKETGDKSVFLVEVTQNKIRQIEKFEVNEIIWENFDIVLDNINYYEEIIENCYQEIKSNSSKLSQKMHCIRLQISISLEEDKKIMIEKNEIRNDIISKLIIEGYKNIWIEKVKLKIVYQNNSGYEDIVEILEEEMNGNDFNDEIDSLKRIISGKTSEKIIDEIDLDDLKSSVVENILDIIRSEKSIED